MGLKKRIESIEDVKEELRSLYREADDGSGYVLDVDGDDGGGGSRQKLDEFRSTNRRLTQELADLRKRLEQFGDIDPEKYRKAEEALSKLEGDEERRLIAEGKLDEVLSRRTEAMKAEFERQVKAKDKALADLTSERNAMHGRLGEVLIDSTLAREIHTVGKLREGALVDALSRARGTFAIDENGNMVPKRGGEVVYGKSGDPLTPAEFAASLLETAPHLFEGASGGGSTGSEAGGASGGSGSGGKAIRADDDKSFLANLDGIASGKVKVQE